MPVNRAALQVEGEAAIDLLERALPALEQLGAGTELRPLCDQLRLQLARDEVLIEVAGSHRARAIAGLIDSPEVIEDPAPVVSLRLAHGDALTVRAVTPDGRIDTGPPDERAALAGRLANCERTLVAETERARALAERQQAAARVAAQVRARQALVRAQPPAPPVSRSRLRAFFGRLMALLTRLFRRQPPQLPVASEPDPEVARLDAATKEGAHLGDELTACKAHLSALSAEHERRRHALDHHRESHHQAVLAWLGRRIAQTDPVEIEVRTPGCPTGVILLVRATANPWREPVDAVLPADGLAADDVRARVVQLRVRHPAELVHRIADALSSCRSQILELQRRAREEHDQRLAALGAIGETQALRHREEAAAQRPVVRHAQSIVDEAATGLERLLAEVRTSWEARIAACTTIEHLRTEVATIEVGAAHRLSMVCDDLIEKMTVQFVRLVLELARRLRQDLMARRREVARDRSPAIEETFEDVRLVLPASLDEAFRALQAPGVGQLLTTERTLLDPLFRTLAREKRDCVARLRARLDDIQGTTTRELFASAVFLSPLLMASLGRIVDEQLTAHQRWIEAAVVAAQHGFEAVTRKQQPALDLVQPLAELEATLRLV